MFASKYMRIATTGLILFVVLLGGCESKNRWIGTYVGLNIKNQQTLKAGLELRANSQGSWSFETTTVPFKWEIRGPEIWLHTKEGGVIVGRLRGDTIEINLLGIGDCLFKKSKNN